MKIMDVVDLTGLSDPLTLHLESSLGIEGHRFFRGHEILGKKQKTTNDCASPSFSMVAMNHTYVIGMGV